MTQDLFNIQDKVVIITGGLGQLGRQFSLALVDRGAQGIILGCTEIPLLVHEKEGNIPLFDTTHIHATAAVELALL